MNEQPTSSSTIQVRYTQGADEVVERVFTQPFTFGRAEQCEVRFATRRVSSVHARVAFVKGQWWVQDLDSRHGTFLDGRKVQHAALGAQATLQLGEGGPEVHLTAGAAAAPAPPPAAAAPAAKTPAPAPAAVVAPQAVAEPSVVYRAHRFTLPLPEDWQDATIYTFLGPFADGLQHNVTVTVEPEAPFDTLEAYAEVSVRALEGQLHGCRMLKKEPVTLHGGLPAYRAIFVWNPTEAHTIYQEQLYVLHEGTGYRLTASFTRKTRKTLGPQVERILLGFTPGR